MLCCASLYKNDFVILPATSIMATLTGGFLYLNLMFPPILLATPIVISRFIKHSISDELLAMMPCEVDKVPFLALMVMIVIAFFTNLIVVFYIAAFRYGTNFYDAALLCFCLCSLLLCFPNSEKEAMTTTTPVPSSRNSYRTMDSRDV